MYEIPFETEKGFKDTVELEEDQFSPENIKAAIKARLAGVEDLIESSIVL